MTKGIITCTDDARVIYHHCEVCRRDTDHVVVPANNFIGIGDDIGELHTCIICRVGKIHILRGEEARRQIIETVASYSMEPLPTIFELNLRRAK